MSSTTDNFGEASPVAGSPREAFERGQIVIGCDVPAEQQGEVHLELPIRVIGWAFSRPGIDHVELGVDGTRVRAQYGLPRADVAEALSEPDAARSGFSALLGEETCCVGPHTLTITAADRDGQTAEITIPIVAEEGTGADEGAEAEDGTESGLDNEGERYVPEDYRGTYTEVEHQARYNWAALLAPGREVLDAGCGVGWGTARLARHARRAVGVDIDEPALASARERAAGTAEFVQADLLALPFADGSFDLVVCFEAIEHVTDPQRALDELRRVLRPGGLLAVSSPNRGVYPAGNPHHMYELTSQELEQSLRGRFANVAMYRQQNHLAALLSDDERHGSSDPEVRVSARLYKTSGGRPGDELYTIGLSSDGELPPVDAVAVLGGPLDTKQLHEHINLLEHRVMLAETKYEAAQRNEEPLLRALEDERAAREAAEAALDSARRSLAEVQTSASWRVTGPLRAAKRAARGNRTPDRPASS